MQNLWSRGSAHIFAISMWGEYKILASEGIAILRGLQERRQPMLRIGAKWGGSAAVHPIPFTPTQGMASLKSRRPRLQVLASSTSSAGFLTHNCVQSAPSAVVAKDFTSGGAELGALWGGRTLCLTSLSAEELRNRIQIWCWISVTRSYEGFWGSARTNSKFRIASTV
jgi:hypothetical protein